MPQQLQHLNLQVLPHTAHLRLGQSGRQVHCHTNTRRIYEITGGRQVNCHTNTRRIYENYRWEAGSLSHKYKTNI